MLLGKLTGMRNVAVKMGLIPLTKLIWTEQPQSIEIIRRFIGGKMVFSLDVILQREKI